MEKTKKNTDNFLKGALLLTLGGIIAKVLGAVYRIPLTNLLGTFAMGLYQLVFPLYGILITVSMGFSIAVSKAVAREKQKNACASCKQILRCALFSLGVVGFVLSLLLFVFARQIATLQGNALIASAYKILSPAVLFVCLSGALRGYFQGQMNMYPTALSQIAEQIAKLLLGLLFAWQAMPNEVKAVNGAILAVTLSEFISLGVFALFYFKQSRKFDCAIDLGACVNTKEIYESLIKSALPVTLGGILAPLSQLIDSFLVLKLLPTDATRLYGIWSGPVHSLFVMPVMLSAGISSAILPDVSGSVAVGNKQAVNTKVNLALKLSSVIVLPCVVGFLFVSPQIIKLLYASLSVEDIYLSGRLLAVTAVGALFVGYSATIGSVLQGAGKEYVSLLVMAISIVIKTALNVFLLPNTKVGIFAVAFSTVLCYFVSVAISMIYLDKKLGVRLDVWAVFTKPLTACVFMAIPLFLANLLAPAFFATTLGTVALIAVAGVFYLAAILGLNVFDGLLPVIKKKLVLKRQK